MYGESIVRIYGKIFYVFGFIFCVLFFLFLFVEVLR